MAQTTYKYSDNLRFIQKQTYYLTIWQRERPALPGAHGAGRAGGSLRQASRPANCRRQYRRESFQYGISMPNVCLTFVLLRTE